jgi:DNA ligase-1
VQLADLVETWQAVRATPARTAKIEALARRLRGARPDEAAAAVAFLSGDLLQRQIGVGWATLRTAPPPAAAPSLTVAEVDAAFAAIGAASGPGAQSERRRRLDAIMARATEGEQSFMRGLLVGELRQGAMAGVMSDAVARAADVPAADFRRALMLGGALPAVAAVALGEGVDGLRAFHLQVGRPILPMLAQTAEDVGAALRKTGPAAVEWKLDGVRLQAHRSGSDVRVFTRTLDDVTSRVPEVAEAVRRLPVASAVLDGEALALRPDGRPRPFQETASRLGTRAGDGDRARSLPLSLMLFDVLLVDGRELIDRPGEERAAELARVVPEELRAPRAPAPDAETGQAFLAGALARGHEGVMVKSLAAPYEAGRRGAAWVKVKPVHTLDLVVLAAEWGHGRRTGTLSNLHLGARDSAGGFVMLGKTFKGLTDELLAWQTTRLLELETGRHGHVVEVRPELVVEVAFDGVQASTRYPGGVALRFARVKGYRPDKRAADADTIEAVRAIHAAGLGDVTEPRS